MFSSYEVSCRDDGAAPANTAALGFPHITAESSSPEV